MSKKLTITQETIRDFVDSESARLDASLTRDKAFEYVAAQQVLTSYGIDDDETERGHVGGGNDGGYDGLYLFVNDVLVNGEDPDALDVPKNARVEFHLIQARNTTGFQESIVQNWKVSFDNLMASGEPDSERYNEKVIEAFQLARGVLRKTISNRLEVSIQFWAVSLAEDVHPNLVKQANELKAGASRILPSENAVVGVEFVTASKLYQFIAKTPDETLSLRSAKEPLCPDAHSAILTVRLADFNAFATDESGELRKALFEANIRDYQGDVTVNKAISRALDESGNVDFWWLNNGITIVADSVVRDMDDSITMVNPRIVNGLQTSNEIWKYCNRADAKDDHRKVLVKCIAATQPEIRAQIIQATNRQSTIPPAYLHSLERIHLQIEECFRRRGLHYDRRKNSCKNSGIPAKDIISVPFFGQCLIAVLLQQPDYARARPAQILSDDKKYRMIFNEQVPMEAYFNLARLSVYVRQYLKKESGLSSAAQNDLIFHILLALCANHARKFRVSPQDLKTMAVPQDDVIQRFADDLNELYIASGGNATVAKSSSFVEKIAEMLGFAA